MSVSSVLTKLMGVMRWPEVHLVMSQGAALCGAMLASRELDWVEEIKQGVWLAFSGRLGVGSVQSWSHGLLWRRRHFSFSPWENMQPTERALETLLSCLTEASLGLCVFWNDYARGWISGRCKELSRVTAEDHEDNLCVCPEKKSKQKCDCIASSISFPLRHVFVCAMLSQLRKRHKKWWTWHSSQQNATKWVSASAMWRR